jgi:hypothetical protein
MGEERGKMRKELWMSIQTYMLYEKTGEYNMLDILNFICA